MDWLDDALCKGLCQDFFYPPLDVSTPNPYYAVGKYVCSGCPVWKECLKECNSRYEVWGMWGGLTPQERKRTNTMKHGSQWRYRAGCHCQLCAKQPDWDQVSVNLSKVPKVGESYDLKSVVFSILNR